MSDTISFLEIFPWNHHLETGNKKIDEQHKMLVALLNRLAHRLISDNEIELKMAFSELADYANQHFIDEEKIFEEYLLDTSLLNSHKKVHSSFFASVAKLQEEAKDEPFSTAVEKIVFFLLKWLINHIIHSDKHLVLIIEYMKAGKAIAEAKVKADENVNNLERTLLDALLSMYHEISSRTIVLMKEIEARKKAEKLLDQANKELKILITTDVLTGLFNRRHLEDIFQRRMRKAIRDKVTLVFFMIDIDFFKSINDTYGHLVGDDALKKLGDCLKKYCRRPDDLAFRIGGEEFCILTSNQTEEDAVKFAEKIRVAVAEMKVANISSSMSEYMTISIGVVNKIPKAEDNMDIFFQLADKRLYMAKKLGRNRVVYSD